MSNSTSNPADRAPSALSLRQISKRFAGVVALDRVDLDVRAGEIHALLGENGAGKSTLIKVVTGVHRPDEGVLLRDGEPVRFGSPRDAAAHGISVVPQDVLFVSELSIGRNILLGSERAVTRRAGLTRAEHALVADALERVGAAFAPTTPTSELSVPQLRLAQIARALISPGNVLVLDEPTAVLSEHDSEQLLERLDALRRDGNAIVYVTHRLGEVMRLADRVSILRDGRKVEELARGAFTREQAIAMMAKDSAPARVPAELVRDDAGAGPSAGATLSVRGLTDRDGRFADVSFEAPPRVIVGIAGVQGSGHGHLLHAIAGARPCDGEVRIGDRPLPTGAIGGSYRRGVMLVPADRRRSSIVAPLSISENLILSGRIRRSARRAGLRWPRRERAITREYIGKLSIRAPGPEAPVGTLSGGNQQKVVLSRALESGPDALLVEEPTQGIDVHAKTEIRALLQELAREDRVVVVATSEFDELLGLADVIHVMCGGRLVATLDGATATYAEILHHALQ